MTFVQCQGSADLIQESDHGLFGHTVTTHDEPDERAPQQAGDPTIIDRTCFHGILHHLATAVLGGALLQQFVRTVTCCFIAWPVRRSSKQRMGSA